MPELYTCRSFAAPAVPVAHLPKLRSLLTASTTPGFAHLPPTHTAATCRLLILMHRARRHPPARH